MSQDAATLRTTDTSERVSVSGRTDFVGQVLMQKLRVVRLLGEGGMGAVYEVEHLITRHRRALKVMHSRYADSKESVTRFVREAGVAGTLKTPHVVETYDAGQLEDGSPYVLMELLKGEPLASLFERGPVPAGRMVGIACQALEGLAVAHDAGIVHRDVKPDNLFVSQSERGGERVRVLDFGISKFSAEGDAQAFSGTLTAEGTMMGTPYYMSPEQASGTRQVDERSDLYSVGVVLYEGLSGRRPFEGHNLASLVIKIHSGDHTPIVQIAPHLPGDLGAVVERAMHVDPKERYPSARELLAALMPFAESAYTASLKTLREVSGEAPTMSGPAISLPPRRAPSSSAPSIDVKLPADRPAWVVPAAVGVSVALVLGTVWLAVTSAGPDEPALAREEPAHVAPAALEPPAVAPPVVVEPTAASPEPAAAGVDPEPGVVRPRVERPVRPRGDDERDDEDDRPRGGRTKILRGVY